MPHGIGGNRCTPSTLQRSGASRYRWRVLRGSMYPSYCVDHNQHDSARSYDLRGDILRVSNCICLGVLHALHDMGLAFQSAPPPSAVNNVAPRRGTRWGCRGQPGTTPHPANSLRVTGSRASKRSHYHHVSAVATGRGHRTSTPGTTQSCPAVE